VKKGALGSSSKRANYGIDSPRVIVVLSAVGASLFVLGAVILSILGGSVGFVGVLTGDIAIVVSAVVLVNVVLLLWTSRVGKLHEVKRLLGTMAFGGGELILDVGCGRGVQLVEAAKHLSSGHAVGVDLWLPGQLTGNMYEAAMENARIEGVRDKIDLQKSDAGSLPFRDASFDVVLSSLAVGYMGGAKKRGQVIGEMTRVMKPGGKIAILDRANSAGVAAILKEKGLSDIRISEPRFRIFPPAHVVIGRKRFAASKAGDRDAAAKQELA
jgi:arsenite methyltransferase